MITKVIAFILLCITAGFSILFFYSIYKGIEVMPGYGSNKESGNVNNDSY